MYKCNNCGLEFETLMKGIGHLSGYGFCQRCQDSDFDEMKKCKICEDYFIDEDTKLSNICPMCESDFVKEHSFNVQALYDLENRKDTVIINSFLAWAFKPEEIEEILLFALKEKQINQPEDFSEYLYCDYDWLEDKIKEVMTNEES